MKQLFALVFLICVQQSSALGFTGLVVADSGEAQLFDFPLEKLVPMKESQSSKATNNEILENALSAFGKELPDEVMWGFSSGIKAGVFGVFRIGVFGGLSFRYARISQ